MPCVFVRFALLGVDDANDSGRFTACVERGVLPAATVMRSSLGVLWSVEVDVDGASTIFFGLAGPLLSARASELSLSNCIAARFRP